MATKSYSKHKEYKEYSSSGSAAPYGDEQFDMLKSELVPRNSKLNDIAARSGGGGTREYHYEYKEEKLPHGKYDRKDMHTVEEYTIPPKKTPKASESSSYYYEREERELPSFNTTTGSSKTYNYESNTSSTPAVLPSFNTTGTSKTYNYESNTSSTPGYSKVKSSKVTKELAHNVDELDSLLDDLQKDQDRQLYKSGYTSDTAESTSFDYRKGSPVKAPSSGYSTLRREERVESSSWGSSPPPPAPAPAPAPAVTRAADIRHEVYKEEKTERRVVPSQISPALPLAVPPTTNICSHCHHTATSATTGTLSRSSTPMNKVTTTVKTYTYEVPADQDPASVPLPTVADHQHTYVSSSENKYSASNTTKVPPSPSLGCQYCSHCNTRLRDVREYRSITTTDDHSKDRVLYPTPANEVKLVPANATRHPVEPLNGHGPYGPNSTFKYSETTYSKQDTVERYPPSHPAPPFPRPTTPSPGNQQPPKRLDDLLADFPEARFPTTETDGVHQRKIAVTHERSTQENNVKPAPPVGSTKNVAGPAVYYPPGHVPFAKKEEYKASAMQGGGAYASGRGMYEYEAGSKSKEKHSEKKTAVPICLPLCCAMPCVIL